MVPLEQSCTFLNGARGQGLGLTVRLSAHSASLAHSEGLTRSPPVTSLGSGRGWGLCLPEQKALFTHLHFRFPLGQTSGRVRPAQNDHGWVLGVLGGFALCLLYSDYLKKKKKN